MSTYSNYLSNVTQVCFPVAGDTVVNTVIQSADLCWNNGLSVALHSTGIHEAVVVPRLFHTDKCDRGCFISVLCPLTSLFEGRVISHTF